MKNRALIQNAVLLKKLNLNDHVPL